jgi:hypothetical protein
MKAEIKAKWVAALRSGEYKQGREALRHGEYFCCLGVLCNLHAQANPDIASSETDPDVYLGEGGVLPRKVALWAGLDPEMDLGPPVKIQSKTQSLASHNDDGRRFTTIAKAIEEQL